MKSVNDLVFADKSDLTSIADVIRAKRGFDDSLSFPLGFINGISGIGNKTFETQAKTVSPTETQQIITPDDDYDGLSSVIIDAISPTYVGSRVTKQVAKTIIPTESFQVAVEPDVYTLEEIMVAPIPSEYIVTTDATAMESDIISGKTAYVNGNKLIGTHKCPEILDTSDATATAEDIAPGKTAYVNGEKITGTMVVQSYYVSNTDPSTSLGSDGDLCLVRGE